MIRKFKFEDEIYSSLSCLPMAARRKLDQLGIKIGLDQWQHLSRGERLMICHAPIASEDEVDALRLFVNEVTLAKSGTPPKALPEEKRQGVNPPATVPPRLVESAHKSGVALTQAAWAALGDDERYALIKLGVEKESHKLKAALDEFVK
ncbi:MAG TPA: nitrate reductase associated protein [Candidatus Binataceae bacterium]|nr:nitrate reductase associated protein [Candidatus Binataceae bacterium]